MNQVDILNAIIKERKRQDALHKWNKDTNRLSILCEELGEVGAALQGDGVLIDELIQLAAVAMRWAEEL